MENIQEIFDKISQLKKEQKEIKKEYKDALENATGYLEKNEELKKLKEEKKKIEERVKGELGSRHERLEEIKRELDELNQMMSDLAINNLTEGKSVRIKDEFNNEYIPVYKVLSKKPTSTVIKKVL